MRILLDHNVPVPLRSLLVGHQVETAFKLGWAELTNGVLLQMAEEAGFEVMITTDKGIRYQQNLSGQRLALVIINTNDWTRIRKSKSVVVDAISAILPGALVDVEIPFY
jgi:hypothetical protein